MDLDELVELRGRNLAFDAMPAICRLAYLHHHSSSYLKMDMEGRIAQTSGKALCNDSKRL